jgi:hypothetical protein
MARADRDPSRTEHYVSAAAESQKIQNCRLKFLTVQQNCQLMKVRSILAVISSKHP